MVRKTPNRRRQPRIGLGSCRTPAWWWAARLLGACALAVALAALLPGAAAPRAAAPGHEEKPTQSRRALREVTIYWVPRPERPRRAIVDTGGVFSIVGKPQPGPACKQGWAPVSGGGYACLDDTEATTQRARAHPELVDDVVPFVYVQRKGDPGYKLAYSPQSPANKAKLVRMGKPLDLQRYEPHEPSRFQGRDLEQRPLTPSDFTLGWTVQPNVAVYQKPGDGKPVAQLDLHTELLVKPRATKSDGRRWHAIKRAKNKPRLYVPESAPIRHWAHAPAMPGVGKSEVWLDVDVGQQMVALRKGPEALLYLTLISAGLPERPTPLGIYRITHKYAYRTMGSLPESADKYFIENVPWTMYFRPHYALHGAYWHDEFGNARSHGCVNLAPLDAAHIYQRVAPEQQPSFFQTFASDKAPGTIVRVRDGNNIDVPDLREDA